MTFREIIEREDQNTDSIRLYREGMFMKAYERSAFFAHTLIYEFKLFKRYIKTVNMDVIYLGFPDQTIPKWLNGYVYEWTQDVSVAARQLLLILLSSRIVPKKVLRTLCCFHITL